MRFGLILGDVPASVGPREHFDQLLRQVHAATAAGFSLITIGQHFLYGDIRCLQPIPTLARLAAEVDAHVQLAIMVLVAPLAHPVTLAEDLATLDIVTEGRLIVGLGLGYRREEFRQFGVPFEDRVRRFAELVTTLRRLWTESEVSTPGPTWPLDGATPHLFPVQQPTPPIWIGANAPAGVRRSARLGDAWPIGPRMPLTEVRELLGLYLDCRDACGYQRSAQPIRREIVLGSSHEDAVAAFGAMTADRYRSYSARERDLLPGTAAVGAESTAAVLGTPEDVRRQLAALASELPVDPVIVRAQWPGMDITEIEAYLAQLGTQVVRPLADLPVRDAAAAVSS
jgi:alkanesulfonate monooxygenase SsuD/methylene tetrahydromethanopterin reductase-like flavin-dependent oxidoreductase (luciferase family)